MGVPKLKKFKLNWDRMAQPLGFIVLMIVLVAGSFAGDVVRDWWKGDEPEKQGPHWTLEDLEVAADIQNQIHQGISELRAITDADRVLIFQLHNSGHFNTGVGMAKVSATHEVTKAGVNQVQETYRDLQLSTVPGIIEMLIADGMMAIDVDQMEHGNLRNRYISYGLDSLYTFPLMSGNEPIGLLSVHYSNEPNESPSEVTLRNAAESLSYQLTRVPLADKS